jgi:hypothetical protein
MREEHESYGLDRLTTAGLIAAAIVVAITIMVLYRVLGVLMDEANERDAEVEAELEADERPHLLADDVAAFLVWKLEKEHAKEAGASTEAGGEG